MHLEQETDTCFRLVALKHEKLVVKHLQQLVHFEVSGLSGWAAVCLSVCVLYGGVQAESVT